ncbi:MAG: ATP-dependent 6-phosphofructokinase, partial [Acidimicrobiia bacterium]|nr:ATP-dependent 6-phosphofructokinase [Acidimicrobiia bacterium]
IQAVVKIGAAQGYDVLGVERGFDGLIDGQTRRLTRHLDGSVIPEPVIDGVGGLGGTFLGSARSSRFLQPDHRAKAAANLRAWGSRGLIVIGGNGSIAGAHALAGECEIPVVAIPASIDNDIGLTREAIGVDTALNTIVEACDRISDTARSHHRAFIVEVMGRDSGYLAMASAVATAADAVLLPEQSRSYDEVVESVVACIRHSFSSVRGKTRVLIIKAEGVDIPTHLLVDQVAAEVGDMEVDVRGTVLGHLVRGGNSSFRDRLIAGRFGLVAVETILQGRTDLMVGWNLTDTGEPTSDSFVRVFPIEDVLSETRALLDGSSQIAHDRVVRMEKIQGVLSL